VGSNEGTVDEDPAHFVEAGIGRQQFEQPEQAAGRNPVADGVVPDGVVVQPGQASESCPGFSSAKNRWSVV
jgi:hypothetical protein